jgi:uncharacterized membrane protein YecN with MAPEG domain
MKIISFYTSLLIILFFVLSMNTIRQRRKNKIAIGHDENPEMLRAIRAHSNFSEYVPINLFAMYLVQAQGANPYFIHFLGLTLLIGRLSHAYGISQVNENFKFRVNGMKLTFAAMISSASYLLYSIFIN